ncbi:hypothetical protein AVW11_24480 [Streptomyces amritsarensis]|uniref:Uncharacterized protein n=1 Tax=Streptomyces amritsarensis TaxID=681158 RepID=A0ABX3G0F1_9ACTN|nr:hypothetical protein AVW11_24480 [Streptomyces amritsarensis]
MGDGHSAAGGEAGQGLGSFPGGLQAALGGPQSGLGGGRDDQGEDEDHDDGRGTGTAGRERRAPCEQGQASEARGVAAAHGPLLRGADLGVGGFGVDGRALGVSVRGRFGGRDELPAPAFVAAEDAQGQFGAGPLLGVLGLSRLAVGVLGVLGAGAARVGVRAFELGCVFGSAHHDPRSMSEHRARPGGTCQLPHLEGSRVGRNFT